MMSDRKELLNALARYADCLQGYLPASAIVAQPDQAIPLLRQHREWSAQHNIRGFGVAGKVSNGKATGDTAIKVYVREKQRSPALPVPESIFVPGFGEIPMDVEQSADPVAQRYDFKVRPVKSGVGIGHKNLDYGTACALVTPVSGEYAGHDFLLSCQHVLYPQFKQNYASKLIIQPSRKASMAAGTEDVVAKHMKHTGLKKHGLNQVDAAIGLFRSSDTPLMKNQIIGQYKTIRGIYDDFDEGDSITMYGAVSGKQTGYIIDAMNSESVRYPFAGQGEAEISFHKIVKCAYKNAEGDSGAPVLLNRNNKLIGMHFAGSGNTGYFCRISLVFRALGIKLVTV